MAGRIGAGPSAEPGVALLAPATSSMPWPRNTTLHSAAEEKPAHARGFQRTAALDARQAALAGASMSLWVIHVIPAIAACPVRRKSGHSAKARVMSTHTSARTARSEIFRFFLSVALARV